MTCRLANCWLLAITFLARLTVIMFCVYPNGQTFGSKECHTIQHFCGCTQSNSVPVRCSMSTGMKEIVAFQYRRICGSSHTVSGNMDTVDSLPFHQRPIPARPHFCSPGQFWKASGKIKFSRQLSLTWYRTGTQRKVFLGFMIYWCTTTLHHSFQHQMEGILRKIYWEGWQSLICLLNYSL